MKNQNSNQKMTKIELKKYKSYNKSFDMRLHNIISLV